jgi:hypothetical protein
MRHGAAPAPETRGQPVDPRWEQSGELMRIGHDVMRLAAKLACVAVVVSVVFPLGIMIFPYVADDFGSLPFSALEAVVSTTIGFGIYAAFFG